MLDIRAIARALGGEVVGRQVLAPGPGHSRADRSLSIRIDPSAPDGFVVHSFTDNDPLVCKDYVRQHLGLPEWQPGDKQDRRVNVSQQARFDQTATAREATKRPRSDDDLLRIKRAVAIWNEADDPRGTAAEDYLKARSIQINDIAELRFHPACVWHKDDDRPDYPPGRKPTLLAAFRPFDSNDVVAIHRIRVDVPRRWPKTLRKMIGPTKGAAVKLAEIDDTLAIAEGVETAMAANQMGHGPAWALGSAGAVANFPVLIGIRRLILLAEHNDASHNACQRCGERWLHAGRDVVCVTPEYGDDLNDELLHRGASWPKCST